jgi:hypothetical protein
VSNDDQRRRTAVHEAGHCLAAHALGWPVRGVTVDGGTEAQGACSAVPPLMERGTFGRETCAPFVLWRPQARQFAEGQALYRMAGEIAELTLIPRAGRSVPLPEQAAQIAAGLPETSPAAVADLAAIVSTPSDSDARAMALLAWGCFGPDWAGMGAWLGWMEASARAVVGHHAAEIERLAGVLAERGTLDGSAIAAVLA